MNHIVDASPWLKAQAFSVHAKQFPSQAMPHKRSKAAEERRALSLREKRIIETIIALLSSKFIVKDVTHDIPEAQVQEVLEHLRYIANNKPRI